MKLPAHNRYDYTPIHRRPQYEWPGGARLAVTFNNNIEYFAFGAGLGSYIAQSGVTLDLLKEAGYRYVMDWAMDDQPIWMRSRAGPILSVPYPLEINDSPALVYRRHTGRQFAEMVIDQFDEMLEQSRKYPLVFAVSVHPFIIGKGFRVRALRLATGHIVRHRDRLWITTPGEIARYCESLPKGTIPGLG